MNEEVITKLAENYCNLEQTLIEELNIDRQSDVSSAEEIWQPVFRRIVPTKFNVEKNVYIIDSHQNVSQKVSLAIYDEQYTPYIFNYGTIKFIPIEAVAAVVLCENEKDKTGEQGKEGEEEATWLDSIYNLRTAYNSVVRINEGLKICETTKEGEVPRSTRPITILYSTTKISSDDNYDIIIQKVYSESNKTYSFTKLIEKENFDLSHWDKLLNYHGVGSENRKEVNRTLESLNVGEQNVLLSLMFQLNQLLMIINNPIFFPHESYVKNAFNGGGDKNGNV